MDPYYLDYAGCETIHQDFRGRRSPYSDNLDTHDYFVTEYLDDDFILQASSLYKERKCIYCAAPLIRDERYNFSWRDGEEETGATMGIEWTIDEFLYHCPICNWWVFSGLTEDYIMPGESSEGRDYKVHRLLAYGKIKTFNLKKEEVPLTELRNWLAKHPHDLAHTNPIAFEKLMTECFKDLYSESEVIHVGKKSNDQGVDIKIIVNNKESILVQVKRREKLDSSEGIKTVRELNGVLLREANPYGMIITTANQFTKGAKKEAKISSALSNVPPFDKYRVDLLSFGNVVDLLKLKNEIITEPWNTYASAFKDIPNRARFLSTR